MYDTLLVIFEELKSCNVWHFPWKIRLRVLLAGKAKWMIRLFIYGSWFAVKFFSVDALSSVKLFLRFTSLPRLNVYVSIHFFFFCFKAIVIKNVYGDVSLHSLCRNLRLSDFFIIVCCFYIFPSNRGFIFLLAHDAETFANLKGIFLFHKQDVVKSNVT